MRRSGSSSCLLRPKSHADDNGDALSVTLLNTESLPSYSAERFYMLSELEIHGHSTLFLCDHHMLGDCDQTLDTMESSEASVDNAPHYSSVVSPFSILYILWRPDQVSSPRAFAEGTVAAAIQQWKSLAVDANKDTSNTEESETFGSNSPKQTSSSKQTTTVPRLYLVVDIAAWPNEESNVSMLQKHDDEEMAQRQFQVQVDTAERLARHVAQSHEFRSHVDGITVGIANHVRAAPGLEACLNAIHVGSRNRRTVASDSKSLVGLIALHPDDLLGLQEATVTDAAQGVLQSCTCAEWNGNGNLLSFARRAHSTWCRMHNVDEEQQPRKQKRKRRRRELNGDFALDFLDPLLTCLVVFLIGYVLSQLWIMTYANQDQ